MGDDDLAAWLDERMRAALARRQFVGATVAITSGDGVLFSAGYGHADLGRGVRADPASTPFRSGSSNKVMTALLALQLVDEGRVDLDGSIADHLTRFRPPEPYGPVTFRHLLTHSAGFEERFQGTLTDRELPELAPPETIRRLWCRQLRPAGQAVQYSNFALALLGAVLEDATGSTYRELLTTRVFDPLGMKSTGVELVGQLPTGCASEHWFRSDGGVRQPAGLMKTPFYLPAGGLFFTAEDVARFLAACLRADSAVVSTAVARAMVEPTVGIPGGAARGLAWWLSDARPEPVFRHGGSTESFDMTMLGIPAMDRGVVIMRTGDWDWRLTGGLRAATGRWRPPVPALDTYAEAIGFATVATAAPVRPMPALAGIGGAFVAGSYLPTRRAMSTSERLFDLAQTGPHRLRAEPQPSVGSVELALDAHGSWRGSEGEPVFEPVPGRPARIARMGSALLERRGWHDRRLATFTVLAASPLAAAAWMAAARSVGAGEVVATALAAAVALAVMVQVLWPPVHWRLWSPMTNLIAALAIGLGVAVVWAALTGGGVTGLLLAPAAAVLTRNRAYRAG